MAGRRRGTGQTPKRTRAVRRGEGQNDTVPGVYQEMLADAATLSPSRFNEDATPVKRRRVGGRLLSKVDGDISGQETEGSLTRVQDTDTDQSSRRPASGQQTYLLSSDDSSDADFDWEEVDLSKNGVRGHAHNDAEDNAPMDIVLETKDMGTSKRTMSRRKAVTAHEREMRLGVHKAHILCLLAHTHLRNYWCEDHQVQVKTLESLYHALVLIILR